VDDPSGLTYRIQDPSQAILKGASTTDGAVQHSGYSKAGSYNLTLGCLGEVKWRPTRWRSERNPR